jgi:hypothetical protein
MGTRFFSSSMKYSHTTLSIAATFYGLLMLTNTIEATWKQSTFTSGLTEEMKLNF